MPTLLLSFALSQTAHAATLTVGPGQDFSTVSQAVLASAPGDRIEVQPGEYLDDTVVFPHGDLSIIGVDGARPVMHVSQDIPNRKGIFVIPVDAGPVTVEHMHFEGARISDGDGANGAGIRMQGSALHVIDCVFTDNQMGLLAGGTEGFTVTVERSEFDANAQEGAGYEHNIYIGSDQCDSFTFIGNYSHHAHSGHQLKSRCKENYILYNRLMDEDTGDASYAIDLPEGGYSVVVGNLIQQGANAENSSAILSYGAEGDNPDMRLFVAHNTIVNDRESAATSFVRAKGATQVVLRNNLFIGAGTPLEIQGDVVPDEQGSLQVAGGGVLVDRAGYDYSILPDSAAQDAGVAVDQELYPELQYLHPVDTQPRWDDAAPDIGAYGIGSAPADTGDTGGGDVNAELTGCSCASSAQRPWSIWGTLLGLGLLGLLLKARRVGTAELMD